MIQNNDFYPEKFSLFYDFCRKENYLNDLNNTPTIAWLMGFFVRSRIIGIFYDSGVEFSRWNVFETEKNKYLSQFQKDSKAYNDFIDGYSYFSYLRRESSLYTLNHDDVSVTNDGLTLNLFENYIVGNPPVVLN